MRKFVVSGAGLVALAAASAGFGTSAHAGRLTFLYDACADTRVQLQTERQAFETQQASAERDAAAAVAPAGYGAAWLAGEKERLRPFFASEIAPSISKAGASADGAFDVWFGEMMGEVSEARRAELVTADYRAERLAAAAQVRVAGEAALMARESESLDTCSAALRNRTARLASRTATAPLRWIGVEADSTAAAAAPQVSGAPAPEVSKSDEKSVFWRAADLLSAPLRLF